MVKFIDLDPKDFDTTRVRGPVSYSILKAFMERNTKVSQLDLEGLHRNPMHLRTALASYIKSHQMPIKVFTSSGVVHLMRLDLDDEANPIDWDPSGKKKVST